MLAWRASGISGIAVPGLDKGKKEHSDVFGLSWRPTRIRKLTLVDAARKASQARAAEADKWADVSRSADFPASS
jgi:hypothetical protein